MTVIISRKVQTQRITEEQKDGKLEVMTANPRGGSNLFSPVNLASFELREGKTILFRWKADAT